MYIIICTLIKITFKIQKHIHTPTTKKKNNSKLKTEFAEETTSRGIGSFAGPLQ